MLMTGYGRGEYDYRRQEWSRMPDLIAENLMEAAKLILQELNVPTDTGTVAQSIIP
jgi:D-glycero-D-manno-heptose 1,7-bisphosphate phosphatase